MVAAQLPGWQHETQTTCHRQIEEPKMFQGYHYIRLSCDYQANENAWVTSKVFQSWLVAFNRKMATLNRIVLLLLDHCAAHTANGLQLNITLMFLPANTTSIMQPLDQGIIHTVKKLYRSCLVIYLIRQLEQQKCSQPKWHMLDAMRNILMAWDNVSADTIQNCFAKSGFGKTGGGAEEERDFEEYVHIDDAVSTKAVQLTDHDREFDNIIPVVTCKHREEEEEDKEEEIVHELPRKKEANSALNALENVLAASDVDTVILSSFDKLCSATGVHENVIASTRGDKLSGTPAADKPAPVLEGYTTPLPAEDR
ncbi:hypothetical protein PR048_031564 [Dryococelus australis]|uniref:DDE-1 domain-containing protein n=1 Tax=Dryococelus australis TaxID=614101 RepID=A0ABQ9G8A7_9NEOP|nr:hypothetical protein PR048_031564 [Dryococelus australis]